MIHGVKQQNKLEGSKRFTVNYTVNYRKGVGHNTIFGRFLVGCLQRDKTAAGGIILLVDAEYRCSVRRFVLKFISQPLILPVIKRPKFETRLEILESRRPAPPVAIPEQVDAREADEQEIRRGAQGQEILLEDHRGTPNGARTG